MLKDVASKLNDLSGRVSASQSFIDQFEGSGASSDVNGVVKTRLKRARRQTSDLRSDVHALTELVAMAGRKHKLGPTFVELKQLNDRVAGQVSRIEALIETHRPADRNIVDLAEGTKTAVAARKGARSPELDNSESKRSAHYAHGRADLAAQVPTNADQHAGGSGRLAANLDHAPLSPTGKNDEIIALQRSNGLLRRVVEHLSEKLMRTGDLVRSQLADEINAFQQETIALNPHLLRDHIRKTQRALEIDDQRLINQRARHIEQNQLFDARFYVSQLGPADLQGLQPLYHYLTRGWLLGLDPHPLFSVRYYLMRNADVLAVGLEPLSHYIEFGSAEMRDPHPLFVGRYYKSTLKAMIPHSIPVLSHFLTAEHTGRPHPMFDAGEYAVRAGLRERGSAFALMHYAVEGWRSGLEPSPLFNTRFYVSQYSTAGAAASEPYTHYVLFGSVHQLDPHPLFDTRYYLQSRPDVSPYEVDPLLHYLLIGEPEGASPSPFFDPGYCNESSGWMTGDRGALWRYVTGEGDRDPHPDFDSALYRQTHDLAADGMSSPLEHFVKRGLYEITGGPVQAAAQSATIGQTLAPAPAIETSGAVHSATPLMNLKDLMPRLDRPEHAIPIKEYPGKRAAVADGPNLLVIAHIAGEYLFGSERSFLDILQGFERMSANVFVVLPKNVPTYTNAIRQHVRKVFVFKYGWWKKDEPPSEAVRNVFANLIDDNDIDAVHSNTIMLREGLDAARSCGIPAVVHVRELIQHDRALVDVIGDAPEKIVSAVKERADWIIGNSQCTADTFLKVDRTFVVPNTVDCVSLDIENKVSAHEVRFGLISSNIHKKGLMDVVELARVAAKSCPKARFLLIGPETDLVSQIRKMQRDGEAPTNIQFPGYAANPKDAISQVNVVLNFSHFAESFGRTVLEAMAARRPVIAYEWGALPELIEHGKNGFLVPFKSPALALQYVKALCKDTKLIRRIGEQGRTLAVEKYSQEQYAETFKKAYARILPGGRGQKSSLPRLNNDLGPTILRARDAEAIAKSVQPPKIAYFVWHFPVPSETFVLSELEALVKSGADVIVFCRQTPHKDFTPSFPIQYERIDTPETLARRLKETSRTIVHAHFTYPTVTEMVWPACEAAKIPFTFIAHAQDIFRYENDKRNRLAEIGASKWCRKLFVLSSYHLDFVVERGFPRDKVVINPNAVDTTRFATASCQGREARRFRRIVAIHRFVEKKGLSNLIRAAALLKDFNVQIDIYGYGELESEYHGLVEALGLDNVSINGPLTQQQVIEVMREADLFACPSVRTADGDMDGIPTSIVESMAAGLPVLTTSISGISDLVWDEVTGIVTNPTPEDVARSIRRFYALPDLQVRAMIDAATQRAASRHDVERLIRVLKRVWENRTTDLVVVSWNNLTELKTVIERILANTALPYHLIICDNQSRREPLQDYLRDLWKQQGRVTVVLNDRNAMVGPGTNLALVQGTSDYAIYICGKEGISFANGWELPFIHALDADPAVGLVGSIGHSPTYLTGSQYPTGIPQFPQFRNQKFAKENPNRVFGHVQGGLFAIRRTMYAEIGGFSDAVPHNYTDVEYSFYAESRGWKLAEAANVLALFNKSRPTLSQRFDESLVAAHPVSLTEIPQFDGVIRGTLKHCNICDWFGEAFRTNDLSCPACGAGRADRSLFRWLSEGKYMYRRLPSLAVGLDGTMAKVWKQQFQGPLCSVSEFLDTLRQSGRLANKASGFHIGYIRCESMMGRESLLMVARELRRLLVPSGKALIQLEKSSCSTTDWQDFKDELSEVLNGQAFEGPTEIVFTSRAVQTTWMPMLEFVRSRA